MKVCDFGRSFVTFTTHGQTNHARLQIESVCTLADRRTGRTTAYWFYASCKSEDTFAAKDLFYKDNYDFCGIFSDEQYVIFRTRSRHTEAFREQGCWRQRFADVRTHLLTVTARALTRPADIVRASLANRPLVGRLVLTSPDAALTATLEFPIKTMNANDLKTIYQVDTGPVMFPDFSVNPELEIARLSPAYVAYNAPDFADFVIQHPLAVAGEKGGEVVVTHYSKLVSCPAQTSVLVVGPAPRATRRS